MSHSHISAALRESVRQRAKMVCEYCLLHEDDVLHGFHLDHVISEKHGGPTEEHNLAFCCPFCNRAKGSDIAGQSNGELIRLFNPRIDLWSDHFVLDAEKIVGRTVLGSVTLRLLGFNDAHRLVIRRELMAAGLFPTTNTRKYLLDSD